MDYNGITFGVGALISIVSGVVAGLGVWFKLKSFVNILAVKLSNMKEEVEKIEQTCADDKKLLHKRLDSQNKKIEDNRKSSDTGLADLKQFMNDMKVEIIREIHSKNE